MKNFNRIITPLCFTANAYSDVSIIQVGSPTAVTLETSTDGSTRTTYTMGNLITLSNIGDKVYFRNTSDTTTGFNIDTNNYYRFQLNGNIDCSGDVTSLINKNCTDTLVGDFCFLRLFYYNYTTNALKTPPELPATTLTQYCYMQMFYNCIGLEKAPVLPATTLTSGCYRSMFQNCTNLEELPKLPAITLQPTCYYYMFSGCSKIKISSTQTGEYQTEYRIPTTGTGTTASNALAYTLQNTGGTYTSSPAINTTYYTSNTLV